MKGTMLIIDVIQVGQKRLLQRKRTNLSSPQSGHAKKPPRGKDYHNESSCQYFQSRIFWDAIGKSYVHRNQ